MPESDKPSFLSELFRKRADILTIGRQTGKNMEGALTEVERQIRQAISGNPITGEKVTKSGKED